LIILYLHIGSNVEVPTKNIIFMLDIELAKIKVNKEFLDKADETINISTGKPKTLIFAENVEDNKTKYILFVSPISAGTLRKRLM